MKRAFIIHGWEATPESNWFPWLKQELEKNGFEVVVPAMPNTTSPKRDEWVSYLFDIIGKVDKDTFLIGHSLGVITILKYLEMLNPPVGGDKIGGAFLVAGFSDTSGYEKEEEFKVLESFFLIELDYEEIKKSCNKFVAIHSDNDPYIPLEKGEIMRERLGAELIILPGMNHLVTGIGDFTLPILLEKILKNLK